MASPTSSGRFLDLGNWTRREHFELFRAFSHPELSICVDVDVSALWQRTHWRGDSFAGAALLVALRAANATPALRLRLRTRPDGTAGVWSHDQVSLTTTFPRADRTFAFARLDDRPTMAEFLDHYATVRAAAITPAPLVVAPPDDDLVYHSALPWLRFTSLTSPSDPARSSVPRLTFGRCTEVAGSWTMPVALEAHHALVDGRDVADFFDAFARLAIQLAP